HRRPAQQHAAARTSPARDGRPYTPHAVAHCPRSTGPDPSFISLLFLHIPPPPKSTLFPYTTLFRSLLRRITRTENILHRNFTRRQVAIQNRVASNIGISQSTFSVKVLNLFSRSRRKTNKRKSKHSAMLRNKETRHRMFIGL